MPFNKADDSWISLTPIKKEDDSWKNFFNAH